MRRKDRHREETDKKIRRTNELLVLGQNIAKLIIRLVAIWQLLH
ncbi:hypothetical protein [Staphylococcus capitis]|nr:hypothetical protein [Staphylococcus capitis]